MTTALSTTVKTQIKVWTTALEAVAPEGYTFTLEVKPNAKYFRIVMDSAGGGRSVHAFVTADGKIYKSAGWKAPAKGVRYDLADLLSFSALLQDVTWSGGYLYAGQQSYRLAAA